MYRTIALSVFIFASILQGYSQRIRVMNQSGREPVENVAIFNQTRSKATISDSLGYARIDLFNDEDTIIFQHHAFNVLITSWDQLSGTDRVYLSRKNILIEEFVISATKSRESKQFVPYMIDVLEESEIKRSPAQTSADILEQTGNVMVQKTQGGGGSPILRGFEANKVLLVVDGVRMNNAIYRNGHLQNSITIDQSILERIEVIFGPTSLIYGSDALGGVIHYYTRDPALKKENQPAFGLHAYSQFSTANRGYVGHFDMNAGTDKFGSLTSATFKNFGDLRIGSNRPPYYQDWGKTLHYVDRINGMDSTLVNENDLIQKKSGYSQLDLLQKFRYSPSQYSDWILNLQYSTSSDIARQDMLNDYSGENLKYAEHYYGPQHRLLTSLKNVYKKDNLLFTNMTTILAFQKVDEDRFTRKFRSDERLAQMEDVQVYSLNIDLLKMWEASRKLNYGMDVIHNRVFSDAWYEDIVSGMRLPAQTRYPEEGSYTWSASAYGSYKWIIDPRYILTGGLRYEWSALRSGFDNPLLTYDEIRIRNGALTGSISLIYHPTKEWQMNLIASSGFRNPNVDDYGKVRAKDELVTVPNEDIKPEYTYNAELGISRLIEGYIKFELTGYYTHMRDAIVRTDFQINGKDSLFYDGEYYKIITNYNTGKAYIYGLSARVTANINPSILLKGTFNYTKGWNTSDDVPLGHIPPIFGRTALTYTKNRFSLDTYIVYQGWKNIDEFSPYGEDNEEEATRYGFPGWWTANLKASCDLADFFSLTLAVENLFDTYYKPYASGISGPGRNFLLTAYFSL